MNKKVVCILVCMLLLSMTFSIVTAQKTTKEDENQGINVLNNSPPSNPELTGPDSAILNSKFVIKAVSNDPDGDQIYYRFKIGEDSPPRSWNGPYTSGYQFKLNVRLIGYTGDLIIGFQAKDENNAESDWTYHTVTYKNAKSKPIISPLINMLQNHPILYQLLLRFLRL